MTQSRKTYQPDNRRPAGRPQRGADAGRGTARPERRRAPNDGARRAPGSHAGSGRSAGTSRAAGSTRTSRKAQAGNAARAGRPATGRGSSNAARGTHGQPAGESGLSAILSTVAGALLGIAGGIAHFVLGVARGIGQLASNLLSSRRPQGGTHYNQIDIGGGGYNVAGSPSFSWTLPKIIALAAIVCCLIGAAVCFVTCSQGGTAATDADDVTALQASDAAAPATPEPAAFTAASIDPLSFDTLQAGADTPFGFDLSSEGAQGPSLSEGSLFSIATALGPYNSSETSAGFLLMDLGTGRGFAYNLDATVYGASSFKGPYCSYVCQECIETGQTSLDSSVANITETESGYRSAGSALVEDLIYEAIVYSSNGANGALREAFDDVAFADWLGSMGIDSSRIIDGTWFPHYTTRDAAKVWMNTYTYLQSGTETSAMLSEVLGQTETSFLRDALSASEGGNLAAVRSKAGWCADSSGTEFDGVCESGIVTTSDGREYLLCIMTGAPYTDANVECLEDLASAVFAARGELA